MIDWSKFTVFADNNLNVAKIAKFFFDGIENTVWKEKMLVTSMFSLCIQKVTFSALLKVGIVW